MDRVALPVLSSNSIQTSRSVKGDRSLELCLETFGSSAARQGKSCRTAEASFSSTMFNSPVSGLLELVLVKASFQLDSSLLISES